MLLSLVVISFYCLFTLVDASTSQSTEKQDVFACDESLPCIKLTYKHQPKAQLRNDEICCAKRGIWQCCRLKFNITLPSSNNQDPVKTDDDKDGLPLVSFGIGATIGIITGILLLFIGCGVAFHYCCRANNSNSGNGYVAPVISERQGQRNAYQFMQTIPIRANQDRSHVHITITSEGVSSINYSSLQMKRPLAKDDPPKYEDITEVSTPVNTSDETQDLNTELPTYHAATRI